MDQYYQPTEYVDHHYERIEHPQLVESGNRLLELGRNVEADVVVEAWLHRAEGWQRWPIVRLPIRATHHIRFPAFQFARFALQLFLGTLELGGGDLCHTVGFASARGHRPVAVGLKLGSTLVVHWWGLCGRMQCSRLVCSTTISQHVPIIVEWSVVIEGLLQARSVSRYLLYRRIRKRIVDLWLSEWIVVQSCHRCGAVSTTV